MSEEWPHRMLPKVNKNVTANHNEVASKRCDFCVNEDTKPRETVHLLRTPVVLHLGIEPARSILTSSQFCGQPPCFQIPSGRAKPAPRSHRFSLRTSQLPGASSEMNSVICLYHSLSQMSLRTDLSLRCLVSFSEIRLKMHGSSSNTALFEHLPIMLNVLTWEPLTSGVVVEFHVGS